MNRSLFQFFLLGLAGLGLAASTAQAVKIADITRISGQRTNTLTGLGLVVGLKGTGDGGNAAEMIRPLAAVLTKLGDPTTVQELANATNVAIVTLTATVPANGARQGDRLKVFVNSFGAATSLKGGRLYVSPLMGPTGMLAPDGLPFALAEGALTLEDPTTPTSACVPDGATMEYDLPAKYIEGGQMTLVLEDASASWTNASTIAKVINDAESTTGEMIAVAADAKNVVITIPAAEREHPDSFISRVERLPVPLLPTEARVVINERTATMVITGDVEISPCLISYKGLSIRTITPAPVPTPRNPSVTSHDLIPLDTTNSGGSKLQDLIAALDQLKVPAEDRIAIIKELKKSGKLHAKIVTE